MNILLIRTDKPEAELHLNKDITKWQAHRELSDTILLKIKELLDKAGLQWQDIQGVGVFSGPGSFTGLRIGVTVANTLAYSLDIPVVGVSSEDWAKTAQKRLLAGDDDKIVKPEYGREARITQARK